eukprot:2021913-Amphidinium_carterae.2
MQHGIAAGHGKCLSNAGVNQAATFDFFTLSDGIHTSWTDRVQCVLAPQHLACSSLHRKVVVLTSPKVVWSNKQQSQHSIWATIPGTSPAYALSSIQCGLVPAYLDKSTALPNSDSGCVLGRATSARQVAANH